MHRSSRLRPQPLHCRRAIASVAIFGLLAAACSENAPSTEQSSPAVSADEGDSENEAAPGTDPQPDVTTRSDDSVDDETPSTESAPDVGDSAPSQTSLDGAIDRALTYVGGIGGAATGTPLKVGYVNQEGATPAFPEVTFGLDAALSFVNNELGGAAGRPIEVERCFANTAEDGTKCGQQFLADDEVQIVLTGTIASDAVTQPLFDILVGKKPVLIGNPITTPDFIAEDGYALTPGAPGVLTGMSIFIANDLAPLIGGVDSVAVVHVDTPAGRLSIDALLAPSLNSLGITDITGVPVSETAGPQEFAAAIQAVGADEADVIIPLVTVQGCIGTLQALEDLEIDTTVVSTALCIGTPMMEHLAQQGSDLVAPDGWYFGNYGNSIFVPGETDLDAYVTMALAFADAEGIANPEYTGFAASSFGNVLTLARLGNQLGADNITAESLRQAIKDFRGPQWGISGQIECGANALLRSVCGSETGIERYVDGEWSNVRSQVDGNPINPEVELPT